jgi:hypothetical protein
MINKVYLMPEAPVGWVIGLARVPESGEPKMEAFLTHFERDYPDEKWLIVFRTQYEAKAYIVANLPTDALEGFQFACIEFLALDLLEFLRDNPDLEGVLFNPGSDGSHFVPTALLMGVLDKALGEAKGDAA